MAEIQQSQRIASLDGVRGMAIAGVFLHHYYHVKLMWVGVDLFFVLSGFLITTILIREKTKPFGSYIGHFYRRRVQRILPPYLVTMCVVTLIYGPRWMHYWYYYFGGMNLLKPAGLYHIEELPLWSLAVEEQFYFIWPLIVYLLPRKRLVPAAATIMALAPLLRFLYAPYSLHSWTIYQGLPFRMDCLAAGALVALLWPQWRERLAADNQYRQTFFRRLAAALLVALVALAFMQRQGINPIYAGRWGNVFLYEVTLTLVGTLFLFALAGGLPKLFQFKPLMWLGGISYTIYLIHVVMLIAVEMYMHLSGNLSRLVAMVFTLFYATVSWYLMEKPILRLGRPDARAITRQTVGATR